MVVGMIRNYHTALSVHALQRVATHGSYVKLTCVGSIANLSTKTKEQKTSYPSYWDAAAARSNGFKTSDSSVDKTQRPFGSLFASHEAEDFPTRASKYSRVDARSVGGLDHIPPKTVMLARDFIDTSLYNPKFGYFSKQALIFSLTQPINFGSIKNDIEFSKYLGSLYKNLDDRLEEVDDNMRQVWHTPTELFRPYYGFALAKYIVEQYKAGIAKGGDPNSPLVVYEVGAGNGTMMTNVIEYIARYEKDLLSKLEYNTIEISEPLTREQMRKRRILLEYRKLPVKINVNHKSVFSWTEVEERECFIILAEVIDNFAHDVLCYDRDTGKPLQAMVCTTEDGDFKELFTNIDDPLIERFLQVTKGFFEKYYPSKRSVSEIISGIFAPSLFRDNSKIFIPTGLLKFIHVIFKRFPRHRLLLSDFDSLPLSVSARNGPVVQTRYNGTMVPCSTYLVQPGYFDIFFPTNFEFLQEMYLSLAKQSEEQRLLERFSKKTVTDSGPPMIRSLETTSVVTQREFLEKYAMIDKTRLQSGENPLLSWYGNVKMFMS